MVGQTLTESWFGNLWKSSVKSISWEPEKPVLGVLAFEVSRLMSKVVNLWQSLTDGRIVRLKEDLSNSIGIQKLVSEDEDYLMDLALAEIIDELGSVGRSVAMLGKKCVDPTYHNLESIFDDPSQIDPKWYGWRYRLKKMEKRVKKMERFVAATEQLYSEIDVLEELEQSLRRMRAGAQIGKVKMLEFQQKVFWQRQDVKNLKEMSPWIRTYDYTVRLLLRSLFTIVERIKFVYGVDQSGIVDGSNDFDRVQSDFLARCDSLPGYASESNASTSRVGRSTSNLGVGGDKNKFKNWKARDRSPSSILCGKQHQMKGRRYAPLGLTGCIMGVSESPTPETYTSSCGSSFRSNGASQKCSDGIDDICTAPVRCPRVTTEKLSFFNSKRRLLDAPPSTLGYAALALHYANIIILIEKLSSSPHLISLDARDDLYNMLPSTICRRLRGKLKTFSRTLALSEHDDVLAAEWSVALVRMLGWLSPLAHNMIRWQLERNFERQRLFSGSNTLLVQTLHFADQVETEAAIVELLMGLNYLFRFGREINETTFGQFPCSEEYDGCLIPRNNVLYDMIDHTL